jgi:cytoskeletal protein CcmA (bactofilin family)
MSRRRTLDHLDRLPITVGREAVITHVEGDSHYMVLGRVQGDGDVYGAVMLAAGAVWSGNIRADSVVVRGRVEGNIHAHSKVELRGTARVTGSISAPHVSIAEGAVVEGRISPDSVITEFRERRTH